MGRLILPAMLTGLFALNAPIMADPPKADAVPKMDSFERGWKNDAGIGVPINMPEAIKAYREAAAAGNALAKGRLAMVYFSGNGVVVNKKAAEQLTKGIFPDIDRLAKNNNAISQLVLSYMYDAGLGVARDEQESLNWLRKAADLNLPLAVADMGVTYENGLGVEQSWTEAVKWYRKAADLNSAMGQTYLGDMYRMGKGVAKDEVEAVRLYQLGAAQNYAHAETNLGYFYDHGCVVPYNPAEAFRLYQLAADQNFAIGQYNLGIMYENGNVVPRNIAMAIDMFRKAAAQGYQNAKKELQCLGYEQ